MQKSRSPAGKKKFTIFLAMRPFFLLCLMFLIYSAKSQINCSVIKVASCDDPNGIISVVASYGTGPYQYSIDGGTTYQNGGYFPRLYSGSHLITVRDANGNISTTSCIVPNTFSPPSVSVPATTPSACLAPTGTITAAATGGTPPYQYSLDAKNWQTGSTFINLASGVYMVVVKDVNGCLTTKHAVWVNSLCTVSPTLRGTVYLTAVGCSSKGAIAFQKNPGNTDSYTYSMDGINYQAANSFSNLDEGVYELYIKNTATNVVVLQGFTVLPSCSFSVIPNIVHATCVSSTGSVAANAQGGVVPYQYSLDGISFQSGNVFSGLSPGNYTIIAKDARGALTSEFVTIYSGCLSLNVNVDHTTCGYNNGKITVTPTGGMGPYRYSIDGVNFQSGNIFSPIPAGNYVVTVLDQNGSSATANATVNASIYDLGITATTQPSSCIMTDGSITLNGFGGIPPYEYSIDHINFQSSNIFNNVFYGQHPGIVRDVTGCLTQTYPIYVPYVCFRMTATTIDASCADNDGSITVTTTDGIAPVTYSIDGINFQADPVFTDLLSGNYTITAKDANNVTINTQAAVAKNCITLNYTVANASCGRANGSISAIVNGGTPPYLYSLNGISFQNSNKFNGLPANDYRLTVKDDNGLLNYALVTINDVAGPAISATATSATCNNTDGTISISGTGGTGGLLYSITGQIFQNNNVFNNLSSGIHDIYVKDANGCITADIINVPLVDDLVLSVTNETICEGTSVTLSLVSNANSFSWTPAAGLNNALIKNPIASPVNTTQYSVQATKGICSKTETITISINPAPVANAGIDETICYGKSSQLNGAGGVSYLWSPATFLSDPTIANPVVVDPTSTITYSLSVKDIKNCTSIQDARVTVVVTPQAKLFAGNDTSAAINQPLELFASDVNNSGFTIYSWAPSYGLDDPASASPTAILNRDVTYTVTAKTPAGCTSTDQVTIKVYKGPDIYVPNAFTPNSDGRNDILVPVPIGLKQLKYFAVYNRWGQQVYRTSVYNSGWDGKINGRLQDAGSFIWMAEGIDYNGKVLIRRGIAILIR